MFFVRDYKRTVKCKVAKFIKTAFVVLKNQRPPQCNIRKNVPLPLYTIIRPKHQTIFYTKNNGIYFYESRLSGKERTVPLYDYKTESYYFMNLSCINTECPYSVINCFKASNGNIYFIYSTGPQNHLNRDIVVHNYTKNKIVYRGERQWWDHDTFKIPIANSLLVSLSRVWPKILIKIIDITKEREDNSLYIEELHVSISQYLMNIIHLMSGKISENNIRMLREIIHNLDNGYITRKNVVFGASDKISAIVTIHGNDIVFYKGFQILFERIKIELKDLTADINNAISLSFMFENNKIFILLGTGEKGSININGSTIHLPPNEFWPIGEYILTNEYDIVKSKLYSVSKVSKDYMIIDNVIFYPYPHIPKSYKSYAFNRESWIMFDNNDVSILAAYDSFVAILGLSSSKISYKTPIFVTSRGYDKVYIIDINKVESQIRQIQRRHRNKSPEIVKFAKDLIKQIRLDDLVLEILSKIYEINPISNSYDYRYYVDEERGCIYLRIIYRNESGYVNVILVRYYLGTYRMPPIVIANFKLKSDELRNNPNLLKSKITAITAYQNCNQLYLSRLLESYRDDFNYNYLNEIIIETNYPFFLLGDVKYNRTKQFKYYNAVFESISRIDVDRIYNVVTWSILGQMGRSNRENCVSFVVSELSLTRKLLLG
jgi:hypothetical protein